MADIKWIKMSTGLPGNKKLTQIRTLPDGDKIFYEDIISDRSERFMIGEIMREKILLKYDKEIPHGIHMKMDIVRDPFFKDRAKS